MLAPVIGILMMSVLAGVFNYQTQEQGKLLTRLQNVDFERAQKLMQLSNHMATNHTQIYELLQTAETVTDEGEFYDEGKRYLYNIFSIETQIEEQIEQGPDSASLSKSEIELFESLLKHISDYRVNTTNAMLMATVDLALAQSVMSNSTKQFNLLNAKFLAFNQSIQQRLNQRLASHQDAVEQKAGLFSGLFVSTIIFVLLLSGILSSVLSRDLQRVIKKLGDLVSSQKKQEGSASSPVNELTTLAIAIEGVRESHASLKQARDNLNKSNQELSKSYATILERESTLEELNAELEIKIVEGKKAEELLLEAKEDAEKANEAKSRFLATMSHEFRTPLNAILGFSEMICSQVFGPLGADKLGAEKYAEYADDIHHSGNHMLLLVNDILDISEIESGRRIITKEAVDIDEIIKDCVRTIRKQVEDKCIELSVELPDEVPFLYADKRSFIQVLLNLLSNAIKFTKQNGSIVISVNSGKEAIEIAVKDTGVGIDPDRLGRVTEPFSQGVKNPYEAQDGTGLGLSIVKSLMETHDGELVISSELGVGTAVTAVFPASGLEERPNVGSFHTPNFTH